MACVAHNDAMYASNLQRNFLNTDHEKFWW